MLAYVVAHNSVRGYGAVCKPYIWCGTKVYENNVTQFVM